MPLIQGIFMPGVHKSVPDLEHINELSKWFALNLGQHIARWAIYALRQIVVKKIVRRMLFSAGAGH